MGTYTEHWDRHKRLAVRCTLQALALVGLGLPLVAAVGYLLSPLSELTMFLFALVMVAWLVGFIVLVVRGSRVDCPRCQAAYSRGKYLVNCPRCGLRMFQEEP
ncbi:hypothetical protein MASR1M101_25580 [Gemmatimonas sp.]